MAVVNCQHSFWLQPARTLCSSCIWLSCSVHWLSTRPAQPLRKVSGPGRCCVMVSPALCFLLSFTFQRKPGVVISVYSCRLPTVWNGSLLLVLTWCWISALCQSLQLCAWLMCSFLLVCLPQNLTGLKELEMYHVAASLLSQVGNIGVVFLVRMHFRHMQLLGKHESNSWPSDMCFRFVSACISLWGPFAWT